MSMIAGPCSSCWRPIWLCACPRPGVRVVTTRRFPIQRGPDVPWEVMAPHESQCQRNHGQSLKRLAERGGLSSSEAWAVVNGLDLYDVENSIGWAEADRLWRQYAERVNLPYDEVDRLLAERDVEDARQEEARASLVMDVVRLRAALMTAKSTIRAWHGIRLGIQEEPAVWQDYQASPEMRAINAALGKTESPE